MSIRLDFICTNRSHLTRLCHVILKSCQLGTTSALSYWRRANLARLLPCHTEGVPTWHDFCPVILKACQLGTTSALSYWRHTNLARLLPHHIEVMSTWHDFYDIILKSCQLGTTSAMSFFLLFIYWVVSYVMLKINLIHNFLRVLVLKNKKLDNRVWIMSGAIKYQNIKIFAYMRH